MSGWERLALLGVGAVLVRLAACSDGGTLGDPELVAGEPTVLALGCTTEYTTTADFEDGSQEIHKSYYAEADVAEFDPATARSLTIILCGKERREGGTWAPAPPNGTFCPEGATCTGQKPTAYDCEPFEDDDVTLQAGKVRVDCGYSKEASDEESGTRWTRVYVSFR